MEHEKEDLTKFREEFERREKEENREVFGVYLNERVFFRLKASQLVYGLGTAAIYGCLLIVAFLVLMLSPNDMSRADSRQFGFFILVAYIALFKSIFTYIYARDKTKDRQNTNFSTSRFISFNLLFLFWSHLLCTPWSGGISSVALISWMIVWAFLIFLNRDWFWNENEDLAAKNDELKDEL